jgi:hypothetical protein
VVSFFAMWDEPRVSALLAEHTAIAVSRTAQNQGRLYDRFEQVIYLLPLEVLLDRVRARTNAETTSSDAGRAAVTGTLRVSANGARVELSSGASMTPS